MAEDVESRPKIGRRGEPIQDRVPMPGAEDVESRPRPAGQVQGPKVWDQDPVLLDFDLDGSDAVTLNMIRFTTELMYLA